MTIIISYNVTSHPAPSTKAGCAVSLVLLYDVYLPWLAFFYFAAQSYLGAQRTPKARAGQPWTIPGWA